jgi:hypothetical protein
MTYQSLEMKVLHFFKLSRYVEFLTKKYNIPGNKKPHNFFCIQYYMNIASLAAVLGTYNPFSVTTNLLTQMVIE